MYFFCSDFHLGSPHIQDSSARSREDKIVRWLKKVRSENQVKAIFFVGDLFDFWFEYKTVIPKGFSRFFTELHLLREMNVELHIFTGNHDLWMFDYFVNEFQAKVYHQPIEICLSGIDFYIGHGDGLGPGDKGYKFMKRIFKNPVCQFLFKWIHPDLGIRLAQFLSNRSRKSQNDAQIFLGEEREWLCQYSLYKMKQKPNIQYFIFGHRHLAIDFSLDDTGKRYINLGAWFEECTFARFNGRELTIERFE